MITIERNKENPEVLVWTEPPSIYLDTWALSTLAADATYQTRFWEHFMDRGTILFSLMNVLKIGSYSAPEWPAMRSFLEKVGQYWFPLTIDPIAIIDRQESGTNPPDACVSNAFLTDPHFAKLLMEGDLSLANIVDLTREPDAKDLKRVVADSTRKMRESIESWRREYSRNPNTLDAKWPKMKFNPLKPMRSLYNAFIRLCVTDSFKFTDNHGRDLFHTVAAIACGQIVLLDKHWAVQARKVQKQLALPTEFVNIYDPNQLDQFLEDLAKRPPSRGKHRPTA
jgi:hypothetical protein